jgi:hypothetical protein
VDVTKFLVLYRAPISAREQMANATPEQARAGMEAWMAWVGEAGKAVVDLGAPLGEGTTVGAGNADGDITGFSILDADSQDAAVDLLKGHPHFHTPGGAIEVHEFIAMPGM